MTYPEFILSLPVMDDQQFAEWEAEKSSLYHGKRSEMESCGLDSEEIAPGK